MLTSSRRRELSEILVELVDALDRYLAEGDAKLVGEIRRELAHWAYGLWPEISAEEADALVWGPHARARQLALRFGVR